MYLVNRSGRTLTYALFNSGDSLQSVPFTGPEWFWEDQKTDDMSLKGRDNCKACFADGKQHSFAWDRRPQIQLLTASNLKPDDTVIVKRIEPQPSPFYAVIQLFEVINWSAIHNKHIATSEANAGKITKLDQSAKYAATTIRGIAKGVSLVEVPGLKIISGILDIVAMIVEASTLPNTSEPPPDLIQITDALRTVVREELNKQSAELAATQFINITNWLNELKGSLLGPHSYEDFTRDLENHLSAGGNFQNMLTHMARNSDESMHILPIYAVGISTYVQMLWLHFAVSVAGGDPRSEAMYQLYLTRIQTATDGLSRGLMAASKHVNDHLNNLHARGMLPETGILTKALWNNLCGISGPEDIQQHLKDLNSIISNINADAKSVQSGGDQFLWKSNWSLRAQSANSLDSSPIQESAHR